MDIIGMRTEIIMVVGGGEWQLPIIHKCQAQGYQVLCTNLYSETPGAQAADYFEFADVRDFEKNLEIAKKYEVIAVVTDQSDIAVSTVAYVNERLQLKGITLEVSRAFTDKLIMRNLASKAGVFCPKFFEIRSYSDLKNAVDVLGFPFVLKPRTSQSSRGVVIVKNIYDLESSYRRSIEFSDGLSIIAEEYILGDEYTVEGYKSLEKHYNLSYSIKQHYLNNPSVASRLQYIDKLSEDEKHSLFDQNDTLVKAMNLPFGITHAEYKYRDGTFYLIEIAARGGGTHISSKIVPFTSGIDVNDFLISDAVDGPKIREISIGLGKKACELIFLHFEPGIVANRTSDSEVKKINGVLDFGYSFSIGERLEDIKDDRSRHAHLIIGASNVKELEVIESKVRELVNITYE